MLTTFQTFFHCQNQEKITARTLVLSSVNGDIAIQWEWLKFDPSQNPNPVTDYDKTLHNWLRPRDEHVIQNSCLSVVRERLPKYVKYNTNFLFLIFFSGSPTEVSRGRNGSKHSEWRKDVPFGGLNDGRQHLGVQIPPKP